MSFQDFSPQKMLTFFRVFWRTFSFHPFFQAAKVLGVEAEAFRRSMWSIHIGGGLGLPDFSSSILKGIRSGSYGWETGVFLLVPLKGVISNMWVPSSVLWVPSSALFTHSTCQSDFLGEVPQQYDRCWVRSHPVRYICDVIKRAADLVYIGDEKTVILGLQ